MKLLKGKRLPDGFEAAIGLCSDSDAVCSEAQSQTQSAFSFKWSQRDSYESTEFKKRTRDWLVEKYCGGDIACIAAELGKGGKVILDAGCGSAYSALLLFGEHLRSNTYVGIDISDSVDVAQVRLEECGVDSYLLGQVSISDVTLAPESVDVIFSEGVLHHTDNTRQSMQHLVPALKPGGAYMFYVYKRKSAVREFTDDYIRNALKEKSDEEVWKALRPLTELGIALGELNAKITVPDIPFLGIPGGQYDVQRFVYWHVMKMFYDPTLDIEEMNHINFDWYRPMNCHRHTPDEVQAWCVEAGLDIERLTVQDSGVAVVARKRKQ